MTDFVANYFPLIEINPDWAPVDEENSKERSSFFCQSIHHHIRQNLTLLIAKCKSGELGAETQNAVQLQVDEWVLARAIKDATSTCIHLAGLEQGGSNCPEWLKLFVSQSQQDADHIAPEPPAIDIIAARSHLGPQDLLSDLVEQLCTDFGLEPESQALILLEEQLGYSAELTRELLVLSLSQSLENLDRHLRIYQ